MLALLGVALAALTGNGVYDGLGTVAIGLLLVGVAADPGGRDQEPAARASPRRRRTSGKIVAALVDGVGVESVIHMRTLHLGPEELLVAAKIAVRHDDTAAAVARAIDDAEARIRAAVPIARVIYLEPDIRRPGTTPAGEATGTAPVG